MAFRVLAGALGLFFFVQGLQWLISPATAAAGLGMPLLEGMARSTQIGDLSGFFLCLGGFALYGAYRCEPAWLRAAGILVGLVGFTRTIAWAAHDATFPAPIIAIEFIAGSLLLLAATRVPRPAPPVR